jgi:predicted small lipoprotein YifL
MLKVLKILVTAHALVGGAAMLNGCGQKGALVLPSTPQSAHRATLPQTLNPWRAKPAPVTPGTQADAKTETPAPVIAPSEAPATAPLTDPKAPAAVSQ